MSTLVPPPDVSAERGGDRRRKVLVVEDDANTRSALRLILERDGFDVCEVGNGYEAIDVAAAEKPDLVLLDLALPGLNGLDVASHLTSAVATRDIPIIAVTASWLGAEAEVMRTIGFTGALSKPFQSRQLLEEIHRVLAKLGQDV
jgi:CheY-like chemotaxis protein